MIWKGIIVLKLILAVGFSRPWHYMFNAKDSMDLIDEQIIKPLCLTGNTKYFVIRKLMDWIEAGDACDKYCSSLATFKSVAEVKVITDVLFSIDISTDTLPPEYFIQKNLYEWVRDRRYWIGLNDLGREGVWTWTRTNQTLNFDMWYPNQPDHLRNKGYKNKEGSEHCVALWNPVFYKAEKHTFNDEPCDMKYYALCNPANQTRLTLENQFENKTKCIRVNFQGC